MEDSRVFCECSECSGEFSIETPMDMEIYFCCFCGEVLEPIERDFTGLGLDYDDE